MYNLKIFGNERKRIKEFPKSQTSKETYGDRRALLLRN